ncbi:mechanosensitive ion channel family protein [Tsuneonella sp. CC-YZS046]|uniref:mechanosensitive ion channel family protein n=1 Tax=Tsuneonella sp. CC-YZS046 TaxID=3042152 RepID=UPI002D78D564|nr:mechanosensitive ion channel family protein [Tsuneonella sp. CC-YZS046]WRO68128.1 mechanosensitive ion channel family protein [Tsuneonella sp. CC-YZS046]
MHYLKTVQKQVDLIVDGFFAMLPSLVIALLVLMITWALARFAVRIADRITRRTSLRADLKQLLDTLVRLAIWIFGLLIAATVVMPGLTPASLVAGLGIGAVAIGFAFQDILENFLAGVLIMLRDKMQIGDLIEAQGILGRVEKITLRETHIRQLTNELTILPNSMIFKNPVKIITDEATRRDEITFGVAVETDLRKAETVIRKVLDGLPAISRDRPVEVYAVNFASGAVNFVVRWWADTRANDFARVKSDVIMGIQQAFDEAGVDMPSSDMKLVDVRPEKPRETGPA